MRLSFAFIGFLTALPLGPAQATDCSPNGQRDQTTMNICANESYMKADAELNSLYKQISERLKGDADTLKLLVGAEKAWLAFRDAECTFAASGVAQGTVYPMIMSECKEGVTSKRVEVLKYYLKCEEGDLCCPVPAK
ncbi:lysozyme inhibitor LprI family protein [Methyloferula stellata]|uniref:lysozyme inhibitor LprI family protein n=1 Tax=Methyloferula stellata TaxID=876270 RepID=UPI00036B74D3|nr:lysozyme inhibitor LprI family protein [Methyloferula stellata]